MSDTIDRQSAIEAISEYGSIWMEYTDNMSIHEVSERALKASKQSMIRILKDLPAVQERKKGKWVTEYDSWGGLFKTVRGHKCSLCNHYLDFDGVNAGRGDANFCPNCGADMREETEDDKLH